jgi:hypothetical protein
MAAIPTLEQEDAKRPSRERESLVGERTRIVNRMKGALARLGVHGFKPTLRGAPERLEALRTPEGAPLPPNTLAELRRDMARLRLVRDQIAEVEAARLERLQQAPAEDRPHAMVRHRSAMVAGIMELAQHDWERQLLSSSEHLARCRVVAGEDLARAVLAEHHLLGLVARPHVDVVALGVALGAGGPPIVGDRSDVVGRHAQLVERGGGLRIALVRSEALHGRERGRCCRGWCLRRHRACCH